MIAVPNYHDVQLTMSARHLERLRREWSEDFPDLSFTEFLAWKLGEANNGNSGEHDSVGDCR